MYAVPEELLQPGRPYRNFLRYLAARMPQLVGEWREQRERGGDRGAGSVAG